MILVDSDVVIAHLRGLPVARKWLVEKRSEMGPLSVSVVTIAEIIGGMRSGERREVWRLLDTFIVEDVNEVTARRAGEFMRRFRASHAGIGIGDYLIAGTAETRGLELATLNVKHFPMFKGMRSAFRLARH